MNNTPYEWIKQEYCLEYKFEKDLIITNNFGYTLTVFNIHMQLFEHVNNLDPLTQKLIKLFSQVKYNAHHTLTNSIVLIGSDFEVHFVDGNHHMFRCEEEQVKDLEISLTKRLMKIITHDINNINLLIILKALRVMTFAQIIKHNQKRILSEHGWSNKYCVNLYATEITQDEQTSEFHLVTRLKPNFSAFVMNKYRTERKPSVAQVVEIIHQLNNYDVVSKEIELDIKKITNKIDNFKKSKSVELYEEYVQSIKNSYKILFTNCIEQINAKRIEYAEAKPKTRPSYRRRVAKPTVEPIAPGQVATMLKEIKKTNALDILDTLSDVWTYETYQLFANIHSCLEPKYLALVKSLYDMDMYSRQALLFENDI